MKILTPDETMLRQTKDDPVANFFHKSLETYNIYKTYVNNKRGYLCTRSFSEF
jgi:hypothetical protein